MSRRMASSHLSCSMNFSPIRLHREQRNFRYMKLGPNTRTYQLRCITSLATMRCPQWHRMAVVFMLKIFHLRTTGWKRDSVPGKPRFPTYHYSTIRLFFQFERGARVGKAGLAEDLQAA